MDLSNLNSQLSELEIVKPDVAHGQPAQGLIFSALPLIDF